jgi:hypothetical protein
LKNSMGLYPDTFKSNFAKGVNKQNWSRLRSLKLKDMLSSYNY